MRVFDIIVSVARDGDGYTAMSTYDHSVSTGNTEDDVLESAIALTAKELGATGHEVQGMEYTMSSSVYTVRFDGV